jgi:hypothetical protein
VLTGDGARVVQLQPGGLRPAAEVPAPAGLHNLPLRPGPFIGRSGELDRLDAVSRGPGGVVVQALHGLGGVGKSTLASYWAATRADGFAPIWWITADSPSAVQHGLAAFAVALEAELSVLLSPPALAERALQWLTCHRDWLIVLDNVIDPADVAPVLARTASHGRFLITSRLATTWQHVTTVLRLDVLAEDEALDLLTRTVAAPGRDLDGAADLCARLGHLPLAVEQAAAYLAQNPLLTPRAYLDLMDRYPAGMYAHGAVGIEDRRTLARVWRPTLGTGLPAACRRPPTCSGFCPGTPLIGSLSPSWRGWPIRPPCPMRSACSPPTAWSRRTLPQAPCRSTGWSRRSPVRPIPMTRTAPLN